MDLADRPWESKTKTSVLGFSCFYFMIPVVSFKAECTRI